MIKFRLLALCMFSFGLVSCMTDENRRLVAESKANQTPSTMSFESSNFSADVREGDLVAQQAMKLYEGRDEAIATLDLLSQGLAYLAHDPTFSTIVADMCMENAAIQDYKAPLAEVAERYEAEAGRSVVEAIAERSPAFDRKSFREALSGFVVNDVFLQPEIYLGFLNDNGDFENRNWDRHSVAWVGHGQMGDWTEIPVWQADEAGASRSFMTIEDVYEVPMWEVAVGAKFLGEISPDMYQPFAIPSAKCSCITDQGTGEIACQRSGGGNVAPCSCRKGICSDDNSDPTD